MEAADETPRANGPRVLIVGSCVSRDIFELEGCELELAGYVARTSMASFGMGKVSDPEVRAAAEGLQSAFQRSMILNDLDKTTGERIRNTPHDFVLVDLIDERFSLVRSGQSLFSLSGELERGGFVPGQRDVLSAESEEFLQLWLSGFDRFVRFVGSDRIIVNRAFWAERQIEDDAEPFSQSWVERNNGILARMYQLIERHWNFRRIEYPRDLLLATSTHRWGAARYHYTEAMYRHAAGTISGFFSGRGGSA